MRAARALAALVVLAAIPADQGRAEEPLARPSPTLASGTVQGFLVRSRDETAIGGAVIMLRGALPERFETRTGDDGWFRIPGVPMDARFALDARAEGQPLVMLPGLRVPPSGTLDLHEIEAGAPVTRSWRVLDRRGKPIHGAAAVFRRWRSSPLDEGRYARAQSPRPADASTISGADGVVVLSRVPPCVGLLEIRAEGHATNRGWVDLRDGELYGVEDIVLGRGFGFRGRLRDPDGNDVPRVELFASQSWDRSGLHSATSGADGRFEFGGLPPGTYRVQALTPGGHLTGLAVVQVPGVRSVDLVLDLSASLEGRVLDDRTGKPLPRVPIQLEWMDPGFVHGSAATTSDGEGRYRIDGLPPGRLRDIQCPSGGVFLDVIPSIGETAVRLVAHRTTRLDLRWIPGPVVRGRAADPTGAGVPHVLVSAVVGGRWGHLSAGPVRSSDDGTYMLPLPSSGNGFVEVLAPHHYAAGYPAEPYRFAQHDSPQGPYAFRASDDRECVVDLPLRRGGAVEGVVRTSTGVLAAGAIVVVRQVGGGPGGGGRTAPTGTDGRFRVRAVAPGEGPLFGWAPLAGGGEAWSRHVTLPAGEAEVARDVVVVGEVANVLDGRVVETAPGDLGEGELRLVGAGVVGRRDIWTPPPFGDGVVVPIGDDGSFRTTTTHGRYALVWTVRGCYSETGPQVVVKAGETRERLQVRTPAVGTLSGQVVDEQGRPIEAAEVRILPARDNTVYPQPGSPGWMSSAVLCTTDGEGRFALDAMAGLHYDAEVLVPRRPTVLRRISSAEGPVRIEAPVGLSIRGRVLDRSTGLPLRGIEVAAAGPSQAPNRGIRSALSWRATLRRRTVTGQDGQFEIHGLEAGRCRLEVEDTELGRSIGDPGAGVEYVPAVLEDVPCPKEGLEILMSPGLPIEGVVLDQNGRPAGGLNVSTSRPVGTAGPMSYRSTITDSRGRFRVGGLEAGPHRVEVRRVEDRARPIRGDVTVDGVAAGKRDLVVKVTTRD